MLFSLLLKYLLSPHIRQSCSFSPLSSLFHTSHVYSVFQIGRLGCAKYHAAHTSALFMGFVTHFKELPTTGLYHVNPARLSRDLLCRLIETLNPGHTLCHLESLRFVAISNLSLLFHKFRLPTNGMTLCFFVLEVA